MCYDWLRIINCLCVENVLPTFKTAIYIENILCQHPHYPGFSRHLCRKCTDCLVDISSLRHASSFSTFFSGRCRQHFKVTDMYLQAHKYNNQLYYQVIWPKLCERSKPERRRLVEVSEQRNIYRLITYSIDGVQTKISTSLSFSDMQKK